MQPGETSKAFAAFCAYRDMGPERSLVAVGRELGKSGTLLERWSDRHQWTTRAAAYDAHMDSVRRGGYEKAEHDAAFRAHLSDLRSMAARLKETGRLCLEVADRSLKAALKLPPEATTTGEAAALARTASSCIDMAFNAEAVALGLAESVPDA